jgi:hypothetical protein
VEGTSRYPAAWLRKSTHLGRHPLTPLEHGIGLTRLTRAIGSPSLFRKSGSPTSALVLDHCDTLNHLGFLAASWVAVDVGDHSDAHQCLHVQDTERWGCHGPGTRTLFSNASIKLSGWSHSPDAAPLALVEPLQAFRALQLLQGLTNRNVRLACDRLGGRDVDHGLLRQGTDDLPNRRISSGLADVVEPGRLELLDLVGESLGLCCRPCSRVGELRDTCFDKARNDESPGLPGLFIYCDSRLFLSSGGGIRTRDLRVMSPTSYQTAPPRGGHRMIAIR